MNAEMTIFGSRDLDLDAWLCSVARAFLRELGDLSRLAPPCSLHGRCGKRILVHLVIHLIQEAKICDV